MSDSSLNADAICRRDSMPLVPCLAHEPPVVSQPKISSTRLRRRWLTAVWRVVRLSIALARWSAEAWSQVRVEFRRALALRSEIRRAGSAAAPLCYKAR